MPGISASRPSVIHGHRLAKALIDAGIITLDDRVTRLVIDIPVDGPVRLYQSRVGDERLLDVVELLRGMKFAEPLELQKDEETRA